MPDTAPNRTKWILIALFPALLVLIIAGLIYSQKVSSPNKAIPSASLPISLENSSVAGASIYYRILGTVQNVQKTTGDNFEIDLQSQTGEVLPVKLTASSSQTPVRIKDSTQSASLNDLKSGDQLELIYLIDLKTKQGLATQIRIDSR